VPVVCVHERLSAVTFVLDSLGVLGGSIIVIDFLGALAVRY
jgi:hypothetical protein